MKLCASFLLTVFTIILLLPAQLLACACCADDGHYSLSYQKPDSYQLDEFSRIKPQTARLYLTAGGEDDIKGITYSEGGFQVSGGFQNPVWKFTLTDEKNQTGTIELPLSEKMIEYMVDLHDGRMGEAGGPLLYKEWRFKTKVKSGTGIFKNGLTGGAEYFLVLQGRGNACTSADQFTHWRLEITGKNANFALFGELQSESAEPAETSSIPPKTESSFNFRTNLENPQMLLDLFSTRFL